MAVLHGIKKTCNKRELQNTFIKLTESKIDSYSEGQVIYDHYLDQSLKAKNSSKESININRICSLPGNEAHYVNERTSFLIKKPSTVHLICMFAEGLLEHFSGKMNIKLVVTFLQQNSKS